MTAVELATLYSAASDMIEAHADIVPDDIKRQWPNTLNISLSDAETRALAHFLRTSIRRIEAAR